MFIFGVTVVLYFIKILSGSRKFLYIQVDRLATLSLSILSALFLSSAVCNSNPNPNSHVPYSIERSQQRHHFFRTAATAPQPQNVELVNQVFSLFKGYLNSQLNAQGKNLDSTC